MSHSEKLEIVYISISELDKLPGNPRKLADPDAIDKLKRLISEHGFQNPIQCYKEETGRYTVICGNHRLEAAIDLGYSELPCIVYQGDRNKAIARAISDNKSSDWTSWDYPMLKDMIVEIDTGELDLVLTGFTNDEVESIMGYVTSDADDFGNGGVDEKIHPIIINLNNYQMIEWKRIKKTLKTSKDSEAFIKLLEASYVA